MGKLRGASDFLFKAIKGLDYRPRIAPEFWDKAGKIGKV
jgi:hypothetical protein